MATYKVTREGYRATVITNEGKTLYSGLCPKCDYNLLEKACKRLIQNGEATSYSIDWVSVVTDAG